MKRAPLYTIALLYAVAAAAATGDDAALNANNGATPDLAAIVAGMCKAQTANRARIRAYTVTRDYKVFGKDVENAQSQVIATISYLPPNEKQFEIKQSSGGMGEKIVRRVLEKETELTKDSRLTEISAANYDFKFVREERFQGARAFVLQLLPKRDDKNLVRGQAWVDADTYLIRRIEGSPAKTPSFWIKDIKLVMYFKEVKGMWLQTGTDATAMARVAGKYVFTARDIGYDTSEVVAANLPAPAPAKSAVRAHRSAAMLGMAIGKR